MEEKLIEYIKTEILGEDHSLTSEDDLLSSGMIDSVGIMRLIAFIESNFNIKVPPQDMVIENFITVSAICTYIQQSKS